MLECSDKHSNVEFALQIKDELEKWLSSHNNFKVLIAGKMGTGKTTIVRGFKENYSPQNEDSLLPHTLNVTSYEYTHNGVNFTLIDTPGLNDNIEGSNYLYLKEMVTDEPDMLLFAIKMDDEFRPEDRNVMENVSNAFGWKVWKKAVIILTFANKVRSEGMDHKDRESKKFYNNKREEIALDVTNTLLSFNVEGKVANNIPVVPVGLVSQPLIPSDGRGKSWIKEFWNTVFKVWKTSEQKRFNYKEEL